MYSRLQHSNIPPSIKLRSTTQCIADINIPTSRPPSNSALQLNVQLTSTFQHPALHQTPLYNSMYSRLQHSNIPPSIKLRSTTQCIADFNIPTSCPLSNSALQLNVQSTSTFQHPALHQTPLYNSMYSRLQHSNIPSSIKLRSTTQCIADFNIPTSPLHQTPLYNSMHSRLQHSNILPSIKLRSTTQCIADFNIPTFRPPSNSVLQLNVQPTSTFQHPALHQTPLYNSMYSRLQHSNIPPSIKLRSTTQCIADFNIPTARPPSNSALQINVQSTSTFQHPALHQTPLYNSMYSRLQHSNIPPSIKLRSTTQCIADFNIPTSRHPSNSALQLNVQPTSTFQHPALHQTPLYNSMYSRHQHSNIPPSIKLRSTTQCIVDFNIPTSRPPSNSALQLNVQPTSTFQHPALHQTPLYNSMYSRLQHSNIPPSIKLRSTTQCIADFNIPTSCPPSNSALQLNVQSTSTFQHPALHQTPLYNSMYSRLQHSNIPSSIKLRSTTQCIADFNIPTSPLHQTPLYNSMYSQLQHSNILPSIKLRSTTQCIADFNIPTFRPPSNSALQLNVQPTSTFQHPALHQTPLYNSMYSRLQHSNIPPSIKLRSTTQCIADFNIPTARPPSNSALQINVQSTSTFQHPALHQTPLYNSMYSRLQHSNIPASIKLRSTTQCIADFNIPTFRPPSNSALQLNVQPTSTFQQPALHQTPLYNSMYSRLQHSHIPPSIKLRSTTQCIADFNIPTARPPSNSALQLNVQPTSTFPHSARYQTLLYNLYICQHALHTHLRVVFLRGPPANIHCYHQSMVQTQRGHWHITL